MQPRSRAGRVGQEQETGQDEGLGQMERVSQEQWAEQEAGGLRGEGLQKVWCRDS
jgi:hypothetical protein